MKAHSQTCSIFRQKPMTCQALVSLQAQRGVSDSPERETELWTQTSQRRASVALRKDGSRAPEAEGELGCPALPGAL